MWRDCFQHVRESLAFKFLNQPLPTQSIHLFLFDDSTVTFQISRVLHPPNDSITPGSSFMHCVNRVKKCSGNRVLHHGEGCANLCFRGAWPRVRHRIREMRIRVLVESGQMSRMETRHDSKTIQCNLQVPSCVVCREWSDLPPELQHPPQQLPFPPRTPLACNEVPPLPTSVQKCFF